MKHMKSRTLKRVTPFTAALLLVLAFTAACGKVVEVHGVVTVASTATPVAGSAGAPADNTGTAGGFAAYAVCMRAHGVRDFPDPDSQGRLEINAHPGGDLDPNNPTFQTASNACKSLNPVDNLSPAERARIKTANLTYAACMRAHGISDFPDPQPNGALQIPPRQSGDLNSNNPSFQAANNACKSLLPSRSGGTAGSTATSSGGN